MIPNPIAWLLPEIIDIGNGIQATLDLPAAGVTAPAGARVTSTSDGFVIWLPSIQPTQLGEFGFRYGLQVAQLFGVDFGFGLLKSTCTIDFVRVCRKRERRERERRESERKERERETRAFVRVSFFSIERKKRVFLISYLLPSLVCLLPLCAFAFHLLAE